MTWLHEDWLNLLKRAWSLRVAAFWGAFGGALTVLALFGAALPIYVFGPLFILMSITFAVARVTKQPGID